MSAPRSVIISVVAAAIGLGAAHRADATASQWSYDDLMRRLPGTTVAIEGVRYAIDPSLVVCSGVGRPTVVRGVRRWQRFTCTQTIFRSRTLRDITFGVRALDGRRFVIPYARYGP
jgi:hypothetical protein